MVNLLPPVFGAGLWARPSRRLAMAACAVFAVPLPAQAQLLITPVHVELGARQRSGLLTITADPALRQPLTLQARVMRWRQEIDGRDERSPTSDVVVLPPRAEIGPGESQMFRVVLRGSAPVEREQAYRILLEDVASTALTPAVTSGDGLELQVHMRYDIPVTVTPQAAPVESLNWQRCEATPPRACLRLVNQGNRRARVQGIQAFSGNQAWPVESGPVIVLAGSQREWVFERPGATAPIERVQWQLHERRMDTPLDTP